MATIEDAARVALGLPGVSEGSRYGNRAWAVGKKTFAWQRPFSKADLKRFGDETPPPGPILAVTVEDLGEKAAALEAHPGVFFTIPHFDNFAALLIQLDAVSPAVLTEAITDAWLVVAPADLSAPYLRG